VSILSTQWVADSVARLFAARVDPVPRPDVRFPEVTGRTTVASIPTRHGATTATVYHPNPQNGKIPAVYVNIHGGGFVVGHPEQDDPWCRYLAAHANVAVVNPDYVLASAQTVSRPGGADLRRAAVGIVVATWLGWRQSVCGWSERRREPVRSSGAARA
jgi:acetyl esterase